MKSKSKILILKAQKLHWSLYTVTFLRVLIKKGIICKNIETTSCVTQEAALWRSTTFINIDKMQKHQVVKRKRLVISI